jgi:hypothetical protein
MLAPLFTFVKTNKEFRYLFISGLLFLTGYFFYYVLYDLYSILGFALLVLLGAIILIVTVQSLLKRNRNALILGLSLIGIVTITEIAKSELFKSKMILKAILIDDLSSINLILRENKKFEVRSTYYFGPDKIFEGKYEIQDSKIIFNDKPYSSDFIPDTLFIFEDKIYFQVTTDLTGNVNKRK